MCLVAPRHVHLAVVPESEAARNRNGGLHPPAGSRGVPVLQSLPHPRSSTARVGNVWFQIAFAGDEAVGSGTTGACWDRGVLEVHERWAGVAPGLPLAAVPCSQSRDGAVLVHRHGLVVVGDARSDHPLVGSVFSVCGAVATHGPGGDRYILGAAHIDAPDAVLSTCFGGELAVQVGLSRGWEGRGGSGGARYQFIVHMVQL